MEFNPLWVDLFVEVVRGLVMGEFVRTMRDTGKLSKPKKGGCVLEMKNEKFCLIKNILL